LTGIGDSIGLKDDSESYPYLKLNSLNNIDYQSPIGYFFLNKELDKNENVIYEIIRDRFRNDLIFDIKIVNNKYYLYPKTESNNGILYQADKNKLYQLNILATRYKDDIEVSTYKSSIAVGTRELLLEKPVAEEYNGYTNN